MAFRRIRSFETVNVPNDGGRGTTLNFRRKTGNSTVKGLTGILGKGFLVCGRRNSWGIGRGIGGRPIRRDVLLPD